MIHHKNRVRNSFRPEESASLVLTGRAQIANGRIYPCMVIESKHCYLFLLEKRLPSHALPITSTARASNQRPPVLLESLERRVAKSPEVACIWTPCPRSRRAVLRMPLRCVGVHACGPNLWLRSWKCLSL